jgi:hypothetical protein
MQLKNLVLSVILATGVTSFIIPEHAANGVYSFCDPHPCLNDICRRTEGVHARIGDLPSPAEVEAFKSRPNRFRRASRHGSLMSKRNTTGWSPKATCHPEEGTEDLDHQSTNAANAALDIRSGDDWVQSGCDFYAISDCVVAYTCNLGGDDWRYDAGEHKWAIERITYDCGAYKPGTVTQKDVDIASVDIWKEIGYESYCTSMGHNFCGRGTD